MISTSAWNSRSPCPLPAFKCLIATSLPFGSTPLWTYPKPPWPRRLILEKPSVAIANSSYVNALFEKPKEMPGDGGASGFSVPKMPIGGGEAGICTGDNWGFDPMLSRGACFGSIGSVLFVGWCAFCCQCWSGAEGSSVEHKQQEIELASWVYDYDKWKFYRRRKINNGRNQC